MEQQVLLIIFSLCLGLFIGYSVLPRAKQRTKVIITEREASFESNRLQDGDEFEVFIDNELVLRGKARNNQWQ